MLLLYHTYHYDVLIPVFPAVYAQHQHHQRLLYSSFAVMPLPLTRRMYETTTDARVNGAQLCFPLEPIAKKLSMLLATVRVIASSV